MRKLKVAALLSGEPEPHDLWTLRHMASVGCELSAIQAPRMYAEAPVARSKAATPRSGPLGALSRVIAAAVGARIAADDRAQLEQLFDFEDLRAWWTGSGIMTVRVPALNHGGARAALAAISPDVIVLVSGGGLEARISSMAKLAALNIRHGQSPSVRGMGSMPWGIVEGRRDWIGAAVRLLDDGIGAGPILWRGAPQLAPGDTNVDLFFRAHLEAAGALARILEVYADGGIPPSWSPAADEIPTRKTSAGLRDWVRLLALDRGRRARVLLERGIAC